MNNAIEIDQTLEELIETRKQMLTIPSLNVGNFEYIDVLIADLKSGKLKTRKRD